MDEITAPRRSTHPSSRPSARDPSSIPLAEYVVAVDVDTPQLELYTHVSKDLQAWIEKSKQEYRQAEDEASKVTPELFEEFRGADEESQKELLVCLSLVTVWIRIKVGFELQHQLKLIKAICMLLPNRSGTIGSCSGSSPCMMRPTRVLSPLKL